MEKIKTDSQILIYCFKASTLYILLAYSLHTSGQTAGMQYDPEGRLIQDLSNEINMIKWDNHNHVVEIHRVPNSTKPDLIFGYDALGNKCVKIEKPRNGQGIEAESEWNYTYYVYNGANQLISVYTRSYERQEENFTESLSHYEQHISDHAGAKSVTSISTTIASQAFKSNITEGAFQNKENQNLLIAPWENTSRSKKGTKAYVLTNHTRNTTTVISDRLLNYEKKHAEITAAYDYYPFGMLSRNSTITPYAYGMNGQEKVNEISTGGNHYQARFWMYDSRLGRRWNEDPVTVPYLSPYSTFNNNPVFYTDIEGNKFSGAVFMVDNLQQHLTENQDQLRADIFLQESKADKTETELKNLEKNKILLDEHTQVLAELKQLSDSEQEYIISYDELGTRMVNNKEEDRIGATDNYDGIVHILLDYSLLGQSSQFTEVVLLHELTHAYQFETRKISHDSENGWSGLLANLQDEVLPRNREVLINTLISYKGRQTIDNSNEISFDTKYNPYSFTYGDYLIYNTFMSGKHGRQPMNYFKGWRKYYEMGKKGATIPLDAKVVNEIQKFEHSSNK